MEYPTPTISEKMLFPFFQISSNFLFIGIPAEISIILEVSAGMPMNREFGKKLKGCRKKRTLDVLSIIITSNVMMQN